jgi:hypothetical protein
LPRIAITVVEAIAQDASDRGHVIGLRVPSTGAEEDDAPRVVAIPTPATLESQNPCQ